MNILIAANYATTASGNFIGSLIELGDYLQKNNDKLVFLFPRSINTIREDSWISWLQMEGYKIYLIDLNEGEQEQLSRLNKIICDEKIDILHLHFGLFHSIAVHKRLARNVKIIVHEHMEYPAGCNHLKQTFHYVARSFLYRLRGIRVICVNKNVDKAFAFAKHYYVPNGISFKRNVRTSMTRYERRHELGFKDTDKIVLFLGWDVHRKGLDIAIKAVRECRKIDENIIIAIVGLGFPPKEERVRFIRENTGIEPFEPWIHYLISTEDMFSYHRAADVYLSASRSEAFSYGLLEAISQDTPVVVSDIKGTSWSSEYSKALFYSVEDYKECAKSILLALDTDVERKSNYKLITEKYSINKWCVSLYRIYLDAFRR